MSQLRSVLEEVTTIDLDGLTGEDLVAEIGEVVFGIQTLEVFMTRLLSRLPDTDRLRGLGYSSATNLLCDVGRMSPWRARQVVSYT
ncbi:MAG TPA: hypothetical protein VFP42_02995, partial [Acidimicrobiia bacterium]|nr:hypothetical protein [Acidimicrobiia bacterium]